ncbi:MAG TPA: protein kinase, partial [Gemmatimonadales bacterium]|nr:protein kinase [Gemmatimonadales bacterium]
SLRRRLADGPLSISETTSILRDVARALSYAHEHGVVHRDIKPDNVLLSGGSATVTDFGIAKAISAARANGGVQGTALTQAGMSIGTPAYMAPEQALGDPDTDHRADIYAFGVMAFELIAGRLPFQGSTPSKLLAAHLNEAPPDLLTLRPDCPPALTALITSCLAKDAMGRPQQAAEMSRVLDTVTTSGTGTTIPAILRGGQIRLGRAIGLWVAATAIVGLTAWAATTVVGLPDWVFPGSVGVMLAGLPVIAFTAFAQRTTHRLYTATPGSRTLPQGTMATLAVKASPHLSWRRALAGGAIAVGGFAALVVGFMVLRAMGIGPMGSLRGKGAFGERETLMIADFASPPSDPTLGATVAEALRTDLAQSASLKVMTRSAIRDLLGLMQRPVDTTVSFDLAREVATREGAKAVLDGRIEQLGNSYVVSARLVGTLDGKELALFRETAGNQDELLKTVGKLSREVRGKAGEPLKAIRASNELERVTTSSLPALRKYVEGSRLADEQGDADRGIALIQEAVELDTSFAMAWRKLAALLSNEQRDRAIQIAALTRAFNHRDRLTEMERLLTEAIYYSNGPVRDFDKALTAYRAAILIDSTNTSALNNAANILNDRRNNPVAAESLYRRVVRLPRTFGGAFTNLLNTQIQNGRSAESLDSTVALFRERFPSSNEIWVSEMLAANGKGQYEVSDSIVRAAAASSKGLRQAVRTAGQLSSITELRGQTGDARKWVAHQSELLLQANPSDATQRLIAALDSAYIDSGVDGDRSRALATVRRGMARTPMSEIPAADRPWSYLYELALALRDPGLMREAVGGLERDMLAEADDQVGLRARLTAGVAFTEGRWADAIRDVSIAEQRFSINKKVAFFMRAVAWRELGQRDSSIAEFERLVTRPDPYLVFDSYLRVPGLQALGELYEEKGETKLAIDRYSQITQLWAKADPAHQPRLKMIRERVARLIAKTG